jgi:S1-C subfamily serine protease
LGVLVDAERGYVVANNHVVETDPAIEIPAMD